MTNLSVSKDWSYVSTGINPADITSRGASISDLVSSSWFYGPRFLCSEPIALPEQPHITINDSDPELTQIHSFAISQRNFWPTLDKRLERYFSWISARKAIAIVQRFVNR